MELLEGGELFDKVAQAGRFPEPQAAAVFARLLIAIEFMHKKGVVHRDLKPENVLFGAGRTAALCWVLVGAWWAMRGLGIGSALRGRGGRRGRAPGSHDRDAVLPARRAPALPPPPHPATRAVEAGGKAPTDIKIIDFGYAGIWAPGAELRGLCGTPDYVAPEILSWYEPDSGPNSPLARPEGRVAGVRGGAEGRAQAPAEAEGRGASRAGVVGGAAHADAPGGRAQQLAGGDALAEAPSVSGAGPTATPVSLPGADGGASAPAGSLGAVGVGGGRPYGKASDIWSVGVLLYVLLSGCAPFAAEGEQQLLAKVARADFAFPQREWEAVSDGARDVVRRALVAEPSARATLAELMEHPWCREAVQRALAELRASGALERAGGGKGGRGRGRAAAGCACLVQ